MPLTCAVHLRNTKVTQFQQRHAPKVVSARNQDIAGFEVTVQYTSIVHIVHGQADLQQARTHRMRQS